METQFDSKLDSITPPLLMRPWIGKDFERSKVLFVGESDYDDGSDFHAEWKRDWILRERINGLKKDSKLLNNIDKTVLGEKLNTENQKNLWQSIAYTNVIQRAMDWNEQKRERPTEEDFYNGWITLLQVLLHLKPKSIIKWGVDGAGVLLGNISVKKYSGWEYDELGNDRFLKLKHESGYEAKILFIHHPSYRKYNSKVTGETILSSFPEMQSSLFGSNAN